MIWQADPTAILEAVLGGCAAWALIWTAARLLSGRSWSR